MYTFGWAKSYYEICEVFQLVEYSDDISEVNYVDWNLELMFVSLMMHNVHGFHNRSFDEDQLPSWQN